MSQISDQSEVIEFLSNPAAWQGATASVERLETHGAMVFLAGDVAFKMKRAVRLSYLDFSTLELREAMLRREFALNQPQAPRLYLDVLAITREAGGRLAIGGSGTVVEWLLKMRRFPQTALLLSIVERGEMTDNLAVGVADSIFAYHRDAARPHEARERLDEVATSLLAGLTSASEPRIVARGDTLKPLFSAALDKTAALRAARCKAGFVRRCHGDLHLGNIVVLDGMPTLFDALEFDEALATVDTLYDLAFVLMDLDRHGAGHAAQVVLERYLARSAEPFDQTMLAAMALFLATRACVRAVVAIDRLSDRGLALDPVLATLGHAERYLRLAPDNTATSLFTSP